MDLKFFFFTKQHFTKICLLLLLNSRIKTTHEVMNSKVTNQMNQKWTNIQNVSLLSKTFTSKYFQKRINQSNLFFLTDCVPSGLLQYSVLDDISTSRCCSLHTFPGFGDAHVTGCAVTGTIDRSSIHVITSKYLNMFDSSGFVLSYA